MSSAAPDSKIPFSVTSVKKGTKAEIRIIGEIGWQTGSEDFRREADALLAAGVKDVHIYINTPGGVCTDAVEIVNILRKFAGEITGEGGALVASAGTYISAACSEFEMPENGLYMIHKPRGWASGTAADIEANLKALKDTEAEFFNTYMAKATDPEDFEKKWNAGDYWMTATEAKEAGFITSVSKKVTIDRTSASMIAACGYPGAQTILKDSQNHINEKDEKMNEFLNQLLALLGLPAGSGNDQVITAVNALKAKADTAESLQTEVTSMRDNQIAAIVDGAVASRRITADRKEHFVALGKSAGVDMLRTTIDALTPDGKPMDAIHQQAPGASAKKWDEMTAEERVALHETNPEAYNKMVAEAYK